jgi:hypothetical protein
MRRRRALARWAILAVAVASLTGCVPQVCATAAQFPPGVWLDPSPWLAAHSESTLTACLDGGCKKADAATTAVLQMSVPYRSPAPETGKATYVLTVTSGGSSPLRIRTRVTLHESQVSGPCGTQTWWQADARLNRAGHLSIWHGTSGPFPPQVPRPVTSAPTATN